MSCELAPTFIELVMKVSDGMKQPGKTTRCRVSTLWRRERADRTHSDGNRSSVWRGDRGMEGVNKRNDGAGNKKKNTDPFLDKVDIIAVCTES